MHNLSLSEYSLFSGITVVEYKENNSCSIGIKFMVSPAIFLSKLNRPSRPSTSLNMCVLFILYIETSVGDV